MRKHMTSLPTRLPQRMIETILILAEREEVSISQWIREAVRDRINRDTGAAQNGDVLRESTQ